jgi:hypothetical protein
MKNDSLVEGETMTEKRILNEIKRICRANYGNSMEVIDPVINDVVELFSGKKTGFLKCDTVYHDFSHTLDVVFVFLKIIHGWNRGEKTSRIPEEIFNIGVIAALLHDAGYIKTEDDVGGTGGKYTFIHIQRGIDFARCYLSGKGFREDQIESVRNMLICTGLRIDYETFPFQSREERIIGYALGTADLIAQMAADSYPEKLPLLYREFEEAYHYEGMEKLKKAGALLYNSANDLIKKTPYFYEVIVKERLKKMGSMYKYLTNRSGNHYVDAIEKNIKRIELASMS